MTRTYSELILLPTLKERFDYLKLDGRVGEDTFGRDRIFNQRFYTSTEWKRVRDLVIIRDNGCELAIEGEEIESRIYIHHLNPITMDILVNHPKIALDPENLICCSYDMHNDIHYGSWRRSAYDFVERTANDTSPWRL